MAHANLLHGARVSKLLREARAERHR